MDTLRPHPSPAPRPMARRDLMVEVVGSDVLILEPGSAEVHHLNDTAAAVLELCDGEHTVGEIVAALSDRYGGGGAMRVEEDVATVLADMRRLGLLDEVTG